MVVFFEEGFPAADTAVPQREQLHKALPGARFATEEELAALLGRPTTRLLVLPHGSAFPEHAWAGIHAFLARGGNLLVLGGKPFTRAAYREETRWRLRPESGRLVACHLY